MFLKANTALLNTVLSMIMMLKQDSEWKHSGDLLLHDAQAKKSLPFAVLLYFNTAMNHLSEKALATHSSTLACSPWDC